MYRKSYEIVGYAYGADFHCLDCAAMQYGLKAYSPGFVAEDDEGNPIYPIFLDDLAARKHCGDCGALLSEI